MRLALSGWSAALIVLSALVVGSACSRAPATQEIRVGVTATTDVLPVLVMDAQGIAARHGLRIVQPEPYGGGLALAEALARDEVDVAYPGIVPLLGLVSSGVVPTDVALIGANRLVTPQGRGGAIIAGNNIESWSDLAGAQVATHNPNSVSAATFAARAAAEGLTDFEFVQIGFADMGLAVRDGVVAAAIADEPWATQSLLRGDGHLLGFTMGQPPLEYLPLSAIAIRRELLDGSDLPARFLRAQREAVEYIAAHDSEAQSLLAQRLGISPEVAAQMEPITWAADLRLDLETLNTLQQVLIDAGAQPEFVDPGPIYFPAIAESVLAR